ncbi:hypothetical protein CTI12_AA285150 [Artemisia annua]|uniref:NAC domain-containing protein n=1 Tax=Artemisia annua TaxID=35608 RepID=A0A2U1NC34_ARTAN|nr:hypothetical protein CTI12_AA285150 [Artemisia annua]
MATWNLGKWEVYRLSLQVRRCNYKMLDFSVSDFGYVVKIDGNDGNVIGREMRFVFYEGDVDVVGVVRKTDWYMTEFVTLNEDEGGFAICKVGEDAARAVDDFSSDEYEEMSEESEDDNEDDSDEE